MTTCCAIILMEAADRRTAMCTQEMTILIPLPESAAQQCHALAKVTNIRRRRSSPSHHLYLQ